MRKINPLSPPENRCVECGDHADRSMVCDKHKALYDVPPKEKK